jgi:hypothetical protein
MHSLELQGCESPIAFNLQHFSNFSAQGIEFRKPSLKLFQAFTADFIEYGAVQDLEFR